MLIPSAGTSVEGSTSSVRDQLTVPDTRMKTTRTSKQSPLVAGTPEEQAHVESSLCWKRQCLTACLG